MDQAQTSSTSKTRVAMIVNYRGHEIKAKRERAMGGWDNLYYYIMRLDDLWFLDDGFTTGDDRISDFIRDMKKRVDMEIEEGNSYDVVERDGKWVALNENDPHLWDILQEEYFGRY